MRERDDGITVAFDRTLTPPGPLGNITVNGQPVRGGLVYAGQNGANSYQGDPPALKVSPRVGAVYSINTRTVIRGGYGLYWAPFNAPAPDTTNYGQVGYNQESLIQQGQFRPTVSLANPYPNGLVQPVGNSLGASAGARSRLVTLKRTLACEPSTAITRPSGMAGATLGASSCNWTGSKLVSLDQS